MPVACRSCLGVTGISARLAERLSPGNRMMRHSGAACGLNHAQQKLAADPGSGICSHVVDAGRAAKDMAGGIEGWGRLGWSMSPKQLGATRRCVPRVLSNVAAGFRQIGKRDQRHTGGRAANETQSQ
jgi:hypothetical protein